MKKVFLWLLMTIMLFAGYAFALDSPLEILAYSELRPIESISKSDPVLIGQTAGFSYVSDETTVFMTLLDVTYGSAANKIVKDANMFNSEPGSGQEYIIVDFHIGTLGDDTVSHSFNDYQFDVVSRKGSVYSDSGFVSGIKDSIELYGGATDTLQCAWLINKGDTPYLLYGDKIWFDLDKSLEVPMEGSVIDGTCAYTNCKANLRKETSTKSDRVASLPKGTEVIIKDTQTVDEQVWYFVEVSSMNISGYIWDSLVDIAD